MAPLVLVSSSGQTGTSSLTEAGMQTEKADVGKAIYSAHQAFVMEKTYFRCRRKRVCLLSDCPTSLNRDNEDRG